MSRFTGHLGLQLLEDERGRPILNGAGRCTWRGLPPPLVYDVGEEGSGEEITFAPGATTDLGSIPQVAWSFGFAPDGPGVKPFVIHDLLYRTAGTCVLNGIRYRTRAQPYTRKEADQILRKAMKVVGVPAWRRELIYAAVRLGGAGAWGQ